MKVLDILTQRTQLLRQLFELEAVLITALPVSMHMPAARIELVLRLWFSPDHTRLFSDMKTAMRFEGKLHRVSQVLVQQGYIHPSPSKKKRSTIKLTLTEKGETLARHIVRQLEIRYETELGPSEPPTPPDTAA